jgi:hypothetical protein
MATVAIIHAADDALPARALAEKLRLAKLTVILEKAGDDLRGALRDAKVSIALWSPRSVGQQSVIDDATFARSKTKLVHATMQNSATPSGFGGDKTVNLTGWRGEDDFAAWRELAKLVTDKAGVAPLPPPTPRPAPGFFQPGVVRDPDAITKSHLPPLRPNAQQQQRGGQQPRPAPQQRAQAAPRAAPANMAPAESSGGGRGMMIGIIAFAVIAAAGAGGYYFWNQSQGAASMTAWDSVAQNDPDALRAVLSGDPGEYRNEAQAALAALEERTFEAASDADTIEAFEAFVNDFPESEHALAARGRIAELRSMPEAPAEDETTGVLPPEEAPDPDLLPPNTGAPDTSGGPPSLTPPAEEPTAVEPGAPTN